MNPFDLFTYIIQDCFTGTGTVTNLTNMNKFDKRKFH